MMQIFNFLIELLFGALSTIPSYFHAYLFIYFYNYYITIYNSIKAIEKLSRWQFKNSFDASEAVG